jgi:hypothetical protein
MMEMTTQEKILFIALADELLLTHLGSSEHVSKEERMDIQERFDAVFDANAPKVLREALTETLRNLYEEIKEGDGEV